MQIVKLNLKKVACYKKFFNYNKKLYNFIPAYFPFLNLKNYVGL